jgi:cell wall-associated NlpC family hydrolase
MTGPAARSVEIPPAREGSIIRAISRCAVAFLTCSLVLPASVALASPVSDKKAEAVRIEAQVSALDSKAEAATEDYDQARIAYDALHAKVVKVQTSLASINARTDVLQTSLDVRVDAMYRSGPLGFLDVLLGSATFDDFAATWDFLNEQNKEEAATVASLKVLHVAQAAAEADLKTAEAGAKKVYDTMAARRSEILAADAKAKALLKGVQAEVAALQAADNARRGADAKAAGGGGGGTGWNWGDPARAPRSGVVQIALKYLGRPYRWAASGPGSFDCSGFTMFVYAQVGVHLPHSSAMQIHCGARVSRANLQPGDLLFFYSPIHHVAIYIGNGKMVHAPHTGDVVSIDPVYWQYFVGACRP